MSKKINFPVRLDSDVIDKINAMAVARKISIQDLLCNALEAQDREDRTAATVEERLQNMEKSMADIVLILREFLPRIQDRNRRVYNLETVILGWCEHLLSSSPDSVQKMALWERRKNEIAAELAAREDDKNG